MFGNDLGDEERRHPAQPTLEVERVELLDALQPAHPDADDHADPVGLGERDLQPDWSIAICAAADGVLDERVHLLDLALLDVVLGCEVADLTGDARRKIGGLEAGDASDAGPAGHERRPVLFDTGTEGRDQAHARHDDPSPAVLCAVFHEPRHARKGHTASQVGRGERDA